MNVASIELCKELDNLSGWGRREFLNSFETEKIWQTFKDKSNSSHPYLIDNSFNTIRNYTADFPSDFWPAYDLGYLIRRIPHWIELQGNGTDIWYAQMNQRGLNIVKTEGDNPEDCLIRLAIELFKQGILKREDSYDEK